MHRKGRERGIEEPKGEREKQRHRTAIVKEREETGKLQRGKKRETEEPQRAHEREKKEGLLRKTRKDRDTNNGKQTNVHKTPRVNVRNWRHLEKK